MERLLEKLHSAVAAVWARLAWVLRGPRRGMWRLLRWWLRKLEAPEGSAPPDPCRVQDVEPDEPYPETRRYPGIAATVVVLVAAWVILNQVDAVLEGMRLPGAQGYGVGRALGNMPEAIETWQQWHAGNERLVAPGVMVFVHALVDTVVFVPALATVLAYVLITLFGRIRPLWSLRTESVAGRFEQRRAEIQCENRKIQEANERRLQRFEESAALLPAAERGTAPPIDPLVPIPRRPDFDSIREYSATWAGAFRWTAPLLGLFVIFDVTENLLFGLSYWQDWTATAGLLAAISLLKWLAVGLLVVTVIYVRIAAQPADARLDGRDMGDEARAFVRGLVAMRVPLLIFLVLAVALALGVLDQIPDAIRRWTAVELAASLYFVAGLSLALWLFGLWVHRRVAERVGRYDVNAPGARKLRRRVGMAFLAAAVIQGIAKFIWPDRVGWGLVVPAVIVLFFAVTSMLLPDPEPPPPIPKPRWPKRIIPSYLPRFLAAAPLGALGLAALNAAIPTLIVKRESPSPVGTIFNLILPVALIVVVVLALLWAVRAAVRKDAAAAAGPNAGAEPDGDLAGKVLIALVVVPAVLIWLAWAAGFGDELRDLPALSTNWLLLVAAAGLAASFGAYYLFDPDYFPLRWGRGWVAGMKDLAFEVADDQLNWSPWAKRLGAVTGVAYVLMGVWLTWHPLDAAPLLGTVGIGALWVTSFAFVALFATIFAERTRPPRVLRYLRLSRLPVFVLLVVWVLAAQSPALRIGTFHNVRVAPDAALTDTAGEPLAAPLPAVGDLCGEPLPESQRNIDMEDAFCRWLAANGLLADDAGGAVPLVIVSAWGGGIRAGAWTALVMDCIFEPDGYVDVPARVAGAGDVDLCRRGEAADPFRFSDSVFAVSGISGGSLGFAQYAAFLTGKESPAVEEEWVRSAFGDDFLAPTVSQLLFVDIPLSLAGYVDGPDDRATVTERAWERAWQTGADGEESLLAQGLFSSWRANPHVPLLVLNGTSHTDECRFNTSVLDVGVEAVAIGDDDVPFVFDDCTSLDAFEADYAPRSPATPPVPPESWSLAQTRDLADFLCEDEDVRLSTAALLSARFPVVSPPGRVDRCEADGVSEQAYVTDGGILETSGTLTAGQVWLAVAPLVDAYNDARGGSACVVPFMVHMENGYQPPGAQTLDPALPNEWLAPARSDAKGGLIKNARIAAALPFDDPLGIEGSVSIGERKARTFDYTVDHYAFLTTRAHPGVQAPFGWALSEQAIEDLETQLFENAAQLAEIRHWFSGDLVCP